MDQLSFKLEVFEGPLDLLIHLIQKNKVNIYDIPISEITDQYLEYLEKMQEIDLEFSSEFLVMAATLLYIKSKMLVPRHKDIEEETEDPRQELVEKLLEYKKYKELSLYLGEKEEKARFIFYKKPDEIEIPEVCDQLINLSIDDLMKAFNKLLARNQRKAPPPKDSFLGIVGREKVSIGKKVKDILNLLNRKSKVDFLELFKEMNSRAEIVAGFLAILELMKLNQIIVEQQDNAQIFIRKIENGEINGD